MPALQYIAESVHRELQFQQLPLQAIPLPESVCPRLPRLVVSLVFVNSSPNASFVRPQVFGCSMRHHNSLPAFIA